MAARDDNDCTRSIELVRRAQDGSDDALNALMQRYYEPVRRIVRLRLSRQLRSQMESVDIVQETLTAAVRAFDRFEVRTESSLINWLSAIAENQIRAAHDFMTAQKRDGRRNVPFPVIADGGSSTSLGFDPASSGPLPIDQAMQGEDIDAVEAAIGELREDYREVIIQRDYTGAAWGEVADALEYPSPDAARMAYGRAIVALSELMTKHRKG